MNIDRPEAGTTTGDWLADRFRQCIQSTIDGLVVRDGDGSVAGEITFEYWILAWASKSSRQVQVRVTVDAANAIVTTIPGNVIDWPNQHIDLFPTGCLLSSLMTCPAEPSKTLAQWLQSPDYDMFFTSPSGAGAAAAAADWLRKAIQDQERPG